MNRSGATSGAPGLVISSRFLNSSIVGPAPPTVMSWWISALATTSRMATAGTSAWALRIGDSPSSRTGRRALTWVFSAVKPLA